MPEPVCYSNGCYSSRPDRYLATIISLKDKQFGAPGTMSWAATDGMNDFKDLHELNLMILSRRCAEESDLFFRREAYDPRYCFEIFKRAIFAREKLAWERVYDQYKPQVTGWVHRHSAFHSSGEEISYFVNRAFEKFWTAIPARRFDNFPDLKSLLRYLQLCVHSVILDHTRTMERLKIDQRVSLEAAERPGNLPAMQGPSMKNIESEELWDWLLARLKSEKEQRLIYGSFVLALKPRELLEEFPNTFDDIKEIYRIKENVLARFRRDPELSDFLRMNA